MISEASLIVQLPRDSAVDRHLRADPPPSVTSGRVALEHLAGDAEGRLGPPESGQVVMSVLSPEALIRDRQQVQDVVRRAAGTDEPLMIIVQAAEELREDELAAVLAAAAHTHRRVILRVMADA
jgi:Na+-transporting methylmalonyl-CoA/oxaloacetate decarboxylase gamma subunit